MAESKLLTHPRYRADIDGLRAIAILSVIGYHAFPEEMRGGFVGVDVFFVISGFLISSIIMSNLNEGTFSFTQFYVRRVKRLFPALILVMAACYAFGWITLLPDEFQQMGKHIAAGAAFLSNFTFWQEAGYFDNIGETKPFLHLWSLGIEEQFYVFWPLMLYLAFKRRINFLLVVTVVVVLSFLLNVYLRDSDPVQDFYSPLTRFWELMMGSVWAYLMSQEPPAPEKSIKVLRVKSREAGTTTWMASPWLRNAQSVLGASLIGIAVVLVDRQMAYPGWWALLPTVGSYLVISSGQESWLNRAVLSHRVMVWIGVISYPLYLWHWPLLSFARIMESATPSVGIRLGCSCLAIALAWLTYRLVERPLRFSKQERTSALVLGLLMCVMGGLGYVTYLGAGLDWRPAVQAAEEKMNEELNYKSHWANWSHCPNAFKHCRILDPLRAADIAVIGDSHAGHLASGFAELFGSRGENVVIRLDAGCLPLFELVFDKRKYFHCDEDTIEHALQESINSATIKTIILSGYALSKIDGGGSESSTDFESNGYARNSNLEIVTGNADVFRKATFLTLERLVGSGKKIIYIVDTPELYFDPRECVSFRPLVLPGHKVRTPCAVDRDKFEERNAIYHRIVKDAMSAFPEVRFINAYDYLCDKRLCYGLRSGELLYQTKDHLSPAGSRYLVRKMAPELLK